MYFRQGAACRHQLRLAFVPQPTSGQIFSTSNREYSVNKLFELAEDLPIEKRLTADFANQLEDEVWSEGDKKIRPIDITPKSKHWKRTVDADLRYPIIIGPDNEIMDGYHRLLKAELLGKKFILIQQFKDWPEEAQIDPGETK